MKWHDFFIQMAELCADKSKDRSTQVGAVVVGPDREVRSTGYNGFPRGVNDEIDDRHERPQKYAYTEHAERNCVFHAARVGVSLKDCTLYMNWIPIPCADCARAVIQAGIKTIIGPPRPFGGKGLLWNDSLKMAKEMLDEAGVTIYVWVNDDLITLADWEKTQ